MASSTVTTSIGSAGSTLSKITSFVRLASVPVSNVLFEITMLFKVESEQKPSQRIDHVHSVVKVKETISSAEHHP